MEDGDLTKNTEPDARVVEGDTVGGGPTVGGTEFKLSEAVTGNEPAFCALSLVPGELSVTEFKNFDVQEQPGFEAGKIAFGIKAKNGSPYFYFSKVKELFGTDPDDISDIGAEFPIIFTIERNDGVAQYALDIFNTLDKQAGETFK